VSRRLGMSGLTLSKITSSLLLFTPTGDTRVNVGLNLKFEAKQQKVLGYSRKTESGWEFSEKAIELIREYKDKFPEIIRMLDTNKSGKLLATVSPHATP
jgi:5'-3' exoribonuclease 1